MKNFLITFLSAALLALVAPCVGAAESDYNVIVTQENLTYMLKSVNEIMSEVKVKKELTFLATRADDDVTVATGYGDYLTIDHASAPRSKPVYRAWEPGEIFYTGQRICALPMKLQQGKPADVTFSQTYVAPEQFCNVMLTSGYFTRKSTVMVNVESDIASRIKILPFNFPDNLTLEKSVNKDGSVTYSVTQTDREPWEDERFAPEPEVSAPQLLIAGHFRNVGEIYDFLKERVDSVGSEGDGQIASLTANLCGNAPDVMAKIDSIAAWVRENIRYIAMEHGEFGLRPESPVTVLKNRYGDCKGSASLIKAMLRAAGIDGRLCWIGTRGDVVGRWDELASLSCGNHMIAAAILPDTIVYVDGTTGLSPAGYIPDELRGQQALIEDGAGFMLADVPDVCGDLTTYKVTADLKIEDNALCGSVRHEMGGGFNLWIANAMRGADARSRNRLLERLVSFPKKNVECDSLLFSGGGASGAPVVIDARVRDFGAVRKIGSRLYIDLRPIRDFWREPVDMKKRRHGIASVEPYNYVGEITVILPDGYAADCASSPMRADSPWYSAAIEYRQEGRRLICRSHLSTRRTDASAGEVAAWNAAMKEIKKIAESNIVIYPEETGESSAKID